MFSLILFQVINSVITKIVAVIELIIIASVEVSIFCVDKNSILKTTEDCHRYANDYLNTIDQIAFLDIHKKIPVGIAKYLSRFFAYGLIIIDWYDHMVGEDYNQIARKNWPNYFRYCQKYEITANPDDRLPKIMIDYNLLQEKESKS